MPARAMGFQRDNERLDASTILAELIIVADLQETDEPARLTVSRGYVDRMREALAALEIERVEARTVAALYAQLTE